MVIGIGKELMVRLIIIGKQDDFMPALTSAGRLVQGNSLYNQIMNCVETKVTFYSGKNDEAKVDAASPSLSSFLKVCSAVAQPLSARFDAQL